MPILFQTRERRALIGSFLAALVLVALTVDSVQQSKAQPTASTMFIAPLVQPNPELLTKANSTRKFRIQMVLRGKDLMHTMDVSPNLVGTSWDESARLNRPNTQQLEITMLVNEGSTTDSGSGEIFPYPAAFEQPVIVKPSQFPAIIPMTPTAFEQEWVGWKIRAKATVTDGFINLAADAFFTHANMAEAVYGENTAPIYAYEKDSSGKTESALMSENRGVIPSFETSHTPFYLFAQPEKEYHVKLQQGTQMIDATVRVELLP